MKEFASELEDFPDLLRIVAQHKRLPDTIVEKDYYVVRALRELAGKIGGQFIFKGGTSLSKGWNLLKRFSEDIDVLFRVQDGTGGRLGRGKLDRRLKYAERILHEAPGFRLKGTPNSQRGVHRTSEFEYPKTSTSVASVSNVIKLESGTRGGINPCEDRQITSYISDFAIEKGYTDLANDLSAFGMPCLHITRTAVEKLFAAHQAFQQDRARGKTRHYYDLYELIGLEEVKQFIGSSDFWNTFEDVRSYCEEAFRSTSILSREELTQCSSFFPTGDDFAGLQSNYEESRSLYFVDPPKFADILNRIQDVLTGL